MGIIFTKVLGNTAFYFPIVFNHSLTWFGRVDLKNALTSWVYFSCNNYCCVKEKQTNKESPSWVACRFCGQPSRQDTWRLTGLCSGAQRGTREGWGDLMAGSVWKCLHSHHADTADCQLALLPTCRWQPPFQMPSCGLAVWSLHVGLFGLLYRKAGEFHCESKKRSGQKKLCHLLWTGCKIHITFKAHCLY